MPSVEVCGETWLNMSGGSGSRLTHSWLYQRLNWPIGVMKRPTFRVIHLLSKISIWALPMAGEMPLLRSMLASTRNRLLSCTRK